MDPGKGYKNRKNSRHASGKGSKNISKFFIRHGTPIRHGMVKNIFSSPFGTHFGPHGGTSKPACLAIFGPKSPFILCLVLEILDCVFARILTESRFLIDCDREKEKSGYLQILTKLSFCFWHFCIAFLVICATTLCAASPVLVDVANLCQSNTLWFITQKRFFHL